MAKRSIRSGVGFGRKSKRVLLMSAAATAAIVGYGSLARATIYSYTPTGAATDYWSAGTAAGWSATPVSSTSGQLIFNSIGGTTSNNNISSAFIANVIELDNFNFATTSTQTITSNTGNSVAAGGGNSWGLNGGPGLNPQIYMNADGTSTAGYNFTSNLTTVSNAQIVLGGGGTAALNFSNFNVGGSTNYTDCATISITAVPTALSFAGEGTLILTNTSGNVITSGASVLDGPGTLEIAPTNLGTAVSVTLFSAGYGGRFGVVGDHACSRLRRLVRHTYLFGKPVCPGNTPCTG